MAGAGEVALLLPLWKWLWGCQHCTEEGLARGVPVCPVLGHRQHRDVPTPQTERTAVE